MRPMNSTIAMPPMSTRVCWAFLIFGRRNACTPFAIASTPVSAEQPDAKARSSSRMKAACVVCSTFCTVYAADSATGALPAATRTRPVTTITKTLATNR